MVYLSRLLYTLSSIPTAVTVVYGSGDVHHFQEMHSVAFLGAYVCISQEAEHATKLLVVLQIIIRLALRENIGFIAIFVVQMYNCNPKGQ